MGQYDRVKGKKGGSREIRTGRIRKDELGIKRRIEEEIRRVRIEISNV